MAQLDHNIFMNQQAPDFGKIGEGFERGMRIGDMMRDRKTKDLETQKQNTIKEAYNSGYETKEDGTVAFNPMKVGEFLRGKGLAQDAFKFEQDFKQQQVANLENENKLKFAVVEQTYGDVDFAVKNPGTPQAAKAWESAYDKAERLGYPMAGFSRIYDPNQTTMAHNSLLPIAKQREMEMQKENLSLRREDQKLDRQFKYAQMQGSREDRQNSLVSKVAEKQEKKNAAVTEIQDRYLNMNNEIANLASLIDEDGTYDFVGPQNEIIDQKITSIATDMAKLVDPTSVARESEVAAFKKMLFSPSLFIRNGTAQDVLASFKKMVDDRLGTAYKVRGLDQNPAVTEKTQVEQTQKPAWAK